MENNKIPEMYKVGGQVIEVRRVERCDGNDLGCCFLAGGYVEIADKCNKDDSQSESSKINTFYHELTHSILKTMGEEKLNNDEKFVCTFSSFLTEAMENAYFLSGPRDKELSLPNRIGVLGEVTEYEGGSSTVVCRYNDAGKLSEVSYQFPFKLPVGKVVRILISELTGGLDRYENNT